MAVLEMPATGVGQQHFEVHRVDYQSPTNGGRTGNVTAGFPRWAAEYTLGRNSEAVSDAWRAFVKRLRGGQNTFFGRDVNRPYPRAYLNGFTGLTRAGGGVFDGAAASWSVDGTRSFLTLTGLPAGFKLGFNDYGDFRWSGGEKRALVAFVAEGQANGSGQLTLQVEPPVPTLVPGASTFSFDRPACVMRQVPESRLGAIDRRKSIDGAVIARSELTA